MKGRRLKSIKIRKAPSPSNLYVGVAEQLKALIAKRKLKPGDRIPSERALAQQLDVGRPAIRDALRVLETLGLIQVVPRQGSFVLDPSLDPYLRSIAESLGLALDGHRELLASVCEARRVLGGEIAALAARWASEDDLAKMRMVLQEMEASGEEAFRKADRQFHTLIAAAAKNPVLLKMGEGLYQLVSKSLAKASMSAGNREELLQYYRRILKAVERREAGQAKREMMEHLGRVAGLLLEAL